MGFRIYRVKTVGDNKVLYRRIVKTFVRIEEDNVRRNGVVLSFSKRGVYIGSQDRSRVLCKCKVNV